jgi:beta-lactamase class C
MIADVLELARTPLERFIVSRGVPGLVVAAAAGSDSPSYLVMGTDAGSRALNQDSLFPIASITKLATALAILRLVDLGAVTLDDPVSRHLPGTAIEDNGITLARLLSHSAGLPAWLPDQTPGTKPWSQLRSQCLGTDLAHDPGTRVVYGNVGYGLLGAVIERCTALPLADATRELVIQPLGIEAYLGEEPSRPTAIIADVRSDSKAGSDPINSAAARAAGTPWAGMVTTAVGALALARAFLPESGFLSPATSRLALTSQTRGLGGGFFGKLIWDDCPWGAGPELRGIKDPHWASREASPESFGHVGSSGCVVWVDPRANVAWAILGTRTYFNGWILRCGRGIGQRLISSESGLK